MHIRPGPAAGPLRGALCTVRHMAAATGLLLIALAIVTAAPARAALPGFPQEGSLEDACGVALDSAGDIYVSDYYHHAVEVFGSSFYRPIAKIENEDPLDGPCNLAVDESGDVYVNNFHRNVVKFTPSQFPPPEEGTPAKYGTGTVIDSEHPTGVAVDPATGKVYVDDRTYIAVYEASVHPGEEPVAKIGLGSLEDGYGVAVSDFGATEGDVYVADASDNTVKVFDPSHSLTEPVLSIDGAGTPQSGFTDLTDSNLAVDPSSGHLYVLDDTQPGFEHPAAVLDEFNGAGEYRRQLPHPIVDGEPSGLRWAPPAGLRTTGNWEADGLLSFGPAARRHPPVTRAGGGAGTVKSEPAGIDCATCLRRRIDEVGEPLTLTATPDAHSTFTGWSGCETALGTKCTVTMECRPDRSKPSSTRSPSNR